MISLSDEPALPKRRIGRRKWTQSDINTLMVMAGKYASRGKRIRWRNISWVLSRDSANCAAKYHALLNGADGLAERKEIDSELTRQAIEEKPPASAAAVAGRSKSVEYSRGGATQRLQMHAEILSRIAEQGVTRGLAGDPMPGRSALDKKRLGIVDEPPISQYRKEYELRRPKITLPEVPFG